jgi:hypothetical protein
MPLFQQSVLKKFLSQQDKNLVEKAYKKFTKYFHNPTIQENIRIYYNIFYTISKVLSSAIPLEPLIKIKLFVI